MKHLAILLGLAVFIILPRFSHADIGLLGQTINDGTNGNYGLNNGGSDNIGIYNCYHKYRCYSNTGVGNNGRGGIGFDNGEWCDGVDLLFPDLTDNCEAGIEDNGCSFWGWGAGCGIIGSSASCWNALALGCDVEVCSNQPHIYVGVSIGFSEDPSSCINQALSAAGNAAGWTQGIANEELLSALGQACGTPQNNWTDCAVGAVNDAAGKTGGLDEVGQTLEFASGAAALTQAAGGQMVSTATNLTGDLENIELPATENDVSTEASILLNADLPGFWSLLDIYYAGIIEDTNQLLTWGVPDWSEFSSILSAFGVGAPDSLPPYPSYWASWPPGWWPSSIVPWPFQTTASMQPLHLSQSAAAGVLQ